MARRRRRHLGAVVILTALGVAAAVGLHAVIGATASAFLAGLVTGAGGMTAVIRPRLSLRVTTRGTRPRPVRGRPGHGRGQGWSA
jgi:hypothetical protein